MDRKNDTVEETKVHDTRQDASVDTTTPGFQARLITGFRARIRRLFKKEDPNIYPFF